MLEEKQIPAPSHQPNEGITNNTNAVIDNKPFDGDIKSRLLVDLENQEQKKLTPIDFTPIIGHPELIEEITLAISGKLCEDEESRAYLKSIDDHATTGILLEGLPGTGKSSILRAIEKSLKNHPDIDCKTLDCSAFQGGVGTNAKIINERFDEARNTPKKACVMLIDELDTVMRKKRGLLNDAERTNAMQTNMDGMQDSSKIILIATTNNVNSMEPASVSRFVVISLGLPTSEERKEFIKKYILSIQLEKHPDIDIIVKYTEGFTGRQFRDIGKNLNRIRAIKKKPITIEDITKQIVKYIPYSRKNIIAVNEMNGDNSLNSKTPTILYDISNLDNNTINNEHPTILTVDKPVTESTSHVTELFKDLEDKRKQFEQANGIINTSNLDKFVIWYCSVYHPVYTTLDKETIEYKPSGIKGLCRKAFGLTPEVQT